MQLPRHSSIRTVALVVLAAAVATVAGGVAPHDAFIAAIVLLTFVDLVWALWPWPRDRRVEPQGSGQRQRRVSRHIVLLLLLGCKSAWLLLRIPDLSDMQHGGSRTELLARRDYLRWRILDQHFGPEDSPSFFSPVMKEEWAIGTLSMFGAALANLSFEFPETRTVHLTMVESLIRRMLEPDIRRFEERWWGEDALTSLDGENGHIGYLGHLNLLLGIYRLLGGDSQFDQLHEQISSALARRILDAPGHYLETFPNQIFIPDNAVVLASLAIHDRILAKLQRPVRFQQARGAWLEFTRAKLLDRETGLIVPWVRNGGEPFGRPRGSYSTWDVFYLLQVDAEFAAQQSSLIRSHLVACPIPGMCAVREYLRDQTGPADIDSGPVIFGLSTSGTGFGMSAARALHDEPLLRRLLVTGELIGSTYSDGKGQRYLAAPLIGDAIVLAMRTALPWTTQFVSSTAETEENSAGQTNVLD